ncbi:kelch repeat and BTB domain-containing protein 3-like [Physella acuta]|uniref:kelch repeat and BTB domain-containing protein 3-like n=1 Tax=Physella acuta TaxID=109671 RepID=UPI0027DD4627|nr:kelch repeat and BTB domain-containing protein 3-like [Physella acuta]
MNRQEFCVQIVKCLENVWSENILFDFAVQVQGETIQCHRLILAACSEFFRACFRSEMRETTENSVILNDVSCDVFQLILKALYTGINVLTLENFMEVWRTVHLLQIHFMVQVCEEFAIEAVSMDTWEGIYAIAKLFESKTVLDKLHSFMLSDFEQFSTSPRFLHMSFKEVHQLISSDNVVVNDEEIVLNSVIRWVEFVPENWMNLDESLSDNHEVGNVCDFFKGYEERTR